MDCEEIRPLLDPFGEGMLNTDEMQSVCAHLAACAACRSRARELAELGRALARLRCYEPPATLAARVVAAARRQNQAARPVPAWWSWLLGTGAALAVALCLWLAVEVLAAFEGAGGAEILNLIGSYPHLLWRYPADTALALLETLPVASLTVGLASALLACLLGAQLMATTASARGWPHPNGRA